MPHCLRQWHCLAQYQRSFRALLKHLATRTCNLMRSPKLLARTSKSTRIVKGRNAKTSILDANGMQDHHHRQFLLRTNLKTRSTFKDHEKRDYIKAVKCLMATPPHEQREAVTNRYEEFQATHILLTERVHSVVSFAPLVSFIWGWADAWCRDISCRGTDISTRSTSRP